MSKRIDFASKSGKVEGELAEPASGGQSGKVGGVVVIQEWFGINDHIKSLVERFAGAGYLALAPDLYHGKIAKNEGEAGQMMQALDFPKAIGEIGAAAHYLKEHPRSNGKIAIVGFCLGGALTFATGAHVPGLAALVPFYGVPDLDKLDVSKITAPVLAHFAKHDDWAKPEKAEAIKKKLDALGKPMELHVYDAGHAFMRDSDSSKYNEPSSKKAWERTFEFLKRHLS